MISLKEIKLLNINDIKEASAEIIYYIADYQRGYRWEKAQVEQLLKDIDGNTAGNTYCLQPIMLFEDRDKGWFEVIDGQQRLTTLFIILKAFEKLGFERVPFDIEYSTRKSCIKFLKSLQEYSIVEDYKEINEKWEQLIRDDEERKMGEDQNYHNINNIDNYNIFNAYQTAGLWISKKVQQQQLYDKLLNDVKVIWYPVEITNNAKPKKLFRDVNSGKIRLTSADLIRALYVLEIQRSDEQLASKNKRKMEFSIKWNEIENKLNEDSFWFFINNGKEKNYLTRIGLLFDIITESSANNAYDSYSKYSEKYENNESLEWEKVIELFYKINEWYSNEKYYHRIGFLVNSGISTFYELALEYLNPTDKFLQNSRDKSSFYNFVNLKIRNYIKEKNIAVIKYNSDKWGCRNILLLYNVLLHEFDFPGQKFPFNKFVLEDWSLEHIHPQNPSEFTNIEDLLFWLEDTKNIIISEKEEISEDLPIIQKINDLMLEIKTQENPVYSKNIKEKVRGIKDDLENESKLHNLGNLVLLDKYTNSKIGNGVFRAKRDIVLKLGGKSSLDKSKKNDENFIPYGTTNCFLKRHTAKESLQFLYWSDNDGKKYFDNIKTVLNEC